MGDELENQRIEGIHYGADMGCSVNCLRELIRKRACELFEARRCNPGRALDDWLQAEQEIKHHLGL